MKTYGTLISKNRTGQSCSSSSCCEMQRTSRDGLGWSEEPQLL
uniref:Uncharacterized protein n=1 Tax=Anguilla anguilla TaxID=7936 RepID=A0A0E9R8R1_ANGAN